MADRVMTTVSCTVCKNKNYYFVRGKKKETKLELSKFCKTCDKYTPHKESK